MREIKFRAWVTVEKRMETPATIGSNMLATDHVDAIFGQRGKVFMQFTGLHDKNGKEIYEGDIISYKSKNAECSNVFFENGCFKVQQPTSRCIRTVDYHMQKYQCEVIGNIHENSDLL